MQKLVTEIKNRLSPIELLWIETVANWKLDKEEITERKVVLKLAKDLPTHFQLSNLSYILFASSGDRSKLSAIGYYIATGDSSELDKIDFTLKYIQKKIKRNCDLIEFFSSEIEKPLKLSKIEASNLLNQVFFTARIFDSFSTDQEGISKIVIQRSETIAGIIKYKGVNELLQTFLDFMPPISQTKENLSLPINSNPLTNTWSVFKSEIKSVDPKLVFVIMPFTENWSSDVYSELIEKTIKPLGLQCLRADSLTGSIILEDVWVKINQAG